MKQDGAGDPAGDCSKTIFSLRPETTEMVEDLIMEWSGHYKPDSLWKKFLSEKMTYQTFYDIIRQLLKSNRIATDKEGRLGWIFETDLYENYQRKPELRIR
ncbi:MAG: hypothetical protein JXQ82_00150 [Methanomicrobiaceae archaeon]|nr:hypothetical protein [Methanomicrobiaceae archaeon]